MAGPPLPPGRTGPGGTAERGQSPGRSPAGPCRGDVAQEHQGSVLHQLTVEDAQEAQCSRSWASVSKKIPRASSPSVLLGVDLAQCESRGLPVQRALKEKLQGIVSSVHQVLGALDSQQFESTRAPGGTPGHLQPCAPVAKPAVPSAVQRGPSGILRGTCGMPGRTAAAPQSPQREQSPFRVVMMPQDCVPPQSHQRLDLEDQSSRLPTSISTAPAVRPQHEQASAPPFRTQLPRAELVSLEPQTTPPAPTWGTQLAQPGPRSDLSTSSPAVVRQHTDSSPRESLITYASNRSNRGRSPELPGGQPFCMGQQNLSNTQPPQRHGGMLAARLPASQPGFNAAGAGHPTSVAAGTCGSAQQGSVSVAGTPLSKTGSSVSTRASNGLSGLAIPGRAGASHKSAPGMSNPAGSQSTKRSNMRL